MSDIEVYDEQRLLDDGFTVEQFIDYKALRGDTSDNVPGIAGVGEKTAKQLLEKYGSLDNILANANEIPGKVGQTIAQSKDVALLSKELVTINRDVPVECTLDDIKFEPVYSQKVKQMLSELEIIKLADRMTFADGGEEETKVVALDKEVVTLTSKEQIENAMKGEKSRLSWDKT